MSAKKPITPKANKPAAAEKGRARSGKASQVLFTRLVMRKLNALRQLSVHMGLIAHATAMRVSPEEQLARLHRFGLQPLLLALAIMASPEASATQRAAAALMVEFYIPDWRSLAPSELIGMAAEREDPEVRAWRAAVLERDGHRCTRCGSGQDLHAHHLVRWVDAPWLRVVLENGATLCRPCHVLEHARGG